MRIACTNHGTTLRLAASYKIIFNPCQERGITVQPDRCLSTRSFKVNIFRSLEHRNVRLPEDTNHLSLFLFTDPRVANARAHTPPYAHRTAVQRSHVRIKTCEGSAVLSR